MTKNDIIKEKSALDAHTINATPVLQSKLKRKIIKFQIAKKNRVLN
jgi:hypothetical protein